MLFKFHINLTDKDYLDYNTFWMLRSPYGKKEILKFRIIIAVFWIVISIISLVGGGFSSDAFLGIIPYIIWFVLMQLLMNSVFMWSLKRHLKSLKKKGKMGYSPVAEMEFYEESFVEITSTNKTESKYSSIERISVLSDKVIYIHVNNVMAYLLPLSCFESTEQYHNFFEFIKTKCPNMDMY